MTHHFLRSRASLLPGLTVAAVLFSMFCAGLSAWQQDITTDEPIHLEWSRRLLEQRVSDRGALHFNSKTPVVIPNVLARQAVRRWADTRDLRLLTFAARLPTLLWHLLLLLSVFLLTRSFVSKTAAHLATTGAALEPNLIAHASIATVDAAYALATLLTLWAVLAFARRPSLRHALLIGLALGFAFSTKFTAFLLVPGVLLFPLARPAGAQGERTSWGLYAASTLVVLATTCFVVSAAYLFTGLFVPLSAGTWRSGVIRALAAAWPGFVPPVPFDFITGLDILLDSERAKVFNVVILRRLFSGGVWYYFPLLWLWKTPVLLLLAEAWGLVLAARRRVLFTSPPLRFLALNLALTLAYFCLVFRMQIGYRFVLMCLPLIVILAAAGLAEGRRDRRAQLLGAAVVALTVGENLFYVGNHIAFTNLAVQPKKNVFRLTADTNIDFGQNDERIVAWLRAHPGPRHVEPVHILPGENVINFNLASGAGLFPRHAWLRDHLEPRGHFRHTYLFFDVDPSQFDRFLEEARRLPAHPQDPAVCGDPVGYSSVATEAPLALPDRRRTLVCVETPGRADVALQVLEGRLRWGRPGLRPREFEGLVAGQESWFRLEPGRHLFLAEDPEGVRARLSVRGAGVRVSAVPAPGAQE
jgi:hypothetical protein